MNHQRSDGRRQQWVSPIARDHDYEPLRRKEIRKAKVLSVDDDRVIVDLGVKRDGIAPRKDLGSLDKEYCKSLQVGDIVPVLIADVSDHRDHIVVSLSKGLTQRDWLRAKDLFESGEPCMAKVTQVNRGGAVVRFGRLRGFVPNSHLTSVPRGLRGDHLRQAKSDLVGQILSLVVIEVGCRRGRLILSERVAHRRQHQQLIKELTVGEVQTGIVRNVVDFGAFVDLGGMDGLIHVSELDWRYVPHPSDVLNVGDEVKVYILSVDQERGRIGLSRKRLLPDPWPVVTEDLSEGQVVEGTVTGAVDHGVCVDLGDGVEGLLYVSEMSGGDEVRVSLEPGSSIRVHVLQVDHQRRRILLGLLPVAPVTLWSRVVSLWREALDLVANRRRADRMGQGKR